MQKFGIGQAATRYEDDRLLSGEGRYVDDVNIEDQCYAAFVRSPHAHAKITSIDTSNASSLPGVLAIYTAADLKADGIGDIPCMAPAPNKDGSNCVMPPRPALAEGRVRYVGDAVAVVIAESRALAQDAVEAVWVDYDLLPAVVEINQAITDNANLVWGEAAKNQCFDWEDGDAEATSKAFADASHVVELELVNNRVVPTSMETRGALASIEELSLIHI